MNHALKLVFAVAILLVANVANAQTPPTVHCGSYRVAQGDDCNNPNTPVFGYNGRPTGYRVADVRGGYSGQQQVYAGQQQQVRIGQQGYVNGQRCTWRDRAATGVAGAVIGGLLGAVADRYSNRGGHRNAEAGAMIGAAGGATLFCDPNIVDDNDQVRYQNGNVRVLEDSKCPINNKIHRGLSYEGCLELRAQFAERDTQSADRSPSDGQRPTTYGPESSATKNEAGFTCYLKNGDEQIIADFHDASKNPKGILVTSGSGCREAKRNFRG